MDKILRCDHNYNHTSSAVLSRGAIYSVCSWCDNSNGTSSAVLSLGTVLLSIWF